MNSRSKTILKGYYIIFLFTTILIICDAFLLRNIFSNLTAAFILISFLFSIEIAGNFFDPYYKYVYKICLIILLLLLYVDLKISYTDVIFPYSPSVDQNKLAVKMVHNYFWTGVLIFILSAFNFFVQKKWSKVILFGLLLWFNLGFLGGVFFISLAERVDLFDGLLLVPIFTYVLSFNWRELLSVFAEKKFS